MFCTVMRGDSDDTGSWNNHLDPVRSVFRLSPLADKHVDRRPWPLSNTTLPASGVTARMMILLTVSCRSRSRRPGQGIRPRLMSKLTPSTARTGASPPLPNQPDLRVVYDLVRRARKAGCRASGRS